MVEIKDLIQSADWKKEKHVPVIEAAATVQKSQACTVILSVGKETPHPNTTEHHIRWMELYFLADGEKFAYQIARCEFSSHGEYVQGPNRITVFTAPELTCSFKTDKKGVLIACSYCNIHGLWQSSQPLAVE